MGRGAVRGMMRGGCNDVRATPRAPASPPEEAIGSTHRERSRAERRASGDRWRHPRDARSANGGSRGGHGNAAMREGCAPAGPRRRRARADVEESRGSLARRRLGAVGLRSLPPYCARSPARSAAEGHAQNGSCRFAVRQPRPLDTDRRCDPLSVPTESALSLRRTAKRPVGPSPRHHPARPAPQRSETRVMARYSAAPGSARHQRTLRS